MLLKVTDEAINALLGVLDVSVTAEQAEKAINAMIKQMIERGQAVYSPPWRDEILGSVPGKVTIWVEHTASDKHEFSPDWYRPSRCNDCGLRREHPVHQIAKD